MRQPLPGPPSSSSALTRTSLPSHEQSPDPSFLEINRTCGLTDPGGPRSTRTHVWGRGFGLERPLGGGARAWGTRGVMGAGAMRKPDGHRAGLQGTTWLRGFGCSMLALGYLGFGLLSCDVSERGFGFRFGQPKTQSGTRFRALVHRVSRCVIHPLTFQPLPRLVTWRHPPSTHSRICPSQNPAKQRDS